MPHIIVYTSKMCHPCKDLKVFLNENNIEYEEVDIHENAHGREALARKTGSFSTPVVDIDGKLILGFSKIQIKKALGLE